ncbi:olfactory receptor 52K1-like [Spea bombifrons]|uniref:olfactory receptor 52K1-like n=1 Tax=Spea bombifrons TaxID=233779 RepID=UPI002349E176|nr:olfactory receptor 52K1-like [Spea bombifrons]
MPTVNSSASYTEFILLGFPGVSEYRQLLVMPFSTIYIAIVIGNSAISYNVVVEKTLRAPMYSLFALLLAVNVGCTSAVMPTMLLGFVRRVRVSLAGCLVQMFSVYVMVMLKSVSLLVMAMDRYIAVCMPLRYQKIVTKRFVLQMLFWGLFRNCALAAVVVILASKVHYCKSNVILNFVCENFLLLQLGCGDVSRLQVVGLTVRTVVTVSDMGILLVSYTKVLHAAMKIAVGASRQKALHTCTTHLLVAVLIYTFGLSSSVMYKVEKFISHDAQNLYGAIYFLFPAAINPIIYGLRVKEIKDCLMKRAKRKCFC